MVSRFELSEDKFMGKTKIFDSLRDAVIDYDDEEVVKLSKQAVEEGVDPIEAIEKGLMKGMSHISDRYTEGELYLPELVMAGDAFMAAMSVLEPVLVEQKKELKTLGTVVFGAVFGDLHDIGKNLIATMMRAQGFIVHDIGKDQTVEAFVDKARETDADIVAMTAMISTTMIEQKKIIDALKAAGLRAKTMVGGAMVDLGWTETVGADGTGRDMLEAVAKAKELVGAE
jgi:corrinoid protein of di/trimethylamine methyltransferase